jgi:hypothetical protein
LTNAEHSYDDEGLMMTILMMIYGILYSLTLPFVLDTDDNDILSDAFFVKLIFSDEGISDC